MQAGQHLAAPARCRVGQQRRGRCGIRTRRGRAAVAVEGEKVQLVRFGAECEACTPATDPVGQILRRLEETAQVAGIEADVTHRRGRRTLSVPELVDELVDAYGLVGAHRQQGENGLLLAGAQRQGRSVDPRLERAENAQLHSKPPAWNFRLRYHPVVCILPTHREVRGLVWPPV